MCAIAAKFYPARPDLHDRLIKICKKLAFSVPANGFKSVEVGVQQLRLKLPTYVTSDRASVSPNHHVGSRSRRTLRAGAYVDVARAGVAHGDGGTTGAARTGATP